MFFSIRSNFSTRKGFTCPKKTFSGSKPSERSRQNQSVTKKLLKYFTQHKITFIYFSPCLQVLPSLITMTLALFSLQERVSVSVTAPVIPGE
jgi:hypothetical protein